MSSDAHLDAMGPAQSRARTLAGWSRAAANIAIVVILVAAIVNYGVGPVLSYLRDLRAEPAWGAFWPIPVVLTHMILALPSFLFVDALSHMSRALKEYEEGRFFSPEQAFRVRRAGEDALLALACHIVVSPSLFAWVTGARGGIRFEFEFIHLGLIAFALFVAAIGRVLHVAAALKREHDQIV
jgi:hypothetical protein